MSTTALPTRTSAVRRAPASSNLADVVELILDKGLVIDAYVRVSLVGIELLTVDARVVVASVDTYLRFAEAVDRLHLEDASDAQGLQELTEGTAQSKTEGVIQGVKERIGLTQDDTDDDGEDD